MKRLPLLAASCALMLTASASAQWKSTTYALKGGWNSIYLHGDASYATPTTLFASYPEILEVWRWNPNPNQVQFTTSPQLPSAGTAEWSVWKRDGSVASLSQMLGQSAYLVKCSGTSATTYSRALVQRALPPAATWVRSGANLLGFPSAYTNASYPTFSSYFATFPAAIAANTRIYKYPGGDLGPANPLQLFAPTTEKLDRNQAYWFDSEVVGNFYAPIELSLSKLSGLDFGRTGSVITVKVLNRSATTTTLTLAPVASDAAPGSEKFVTGSVPLTRRVLSAATGTWTETPIVGAYTEVIAPQASVDLSFGIDRSNATMTAAAADAFFASLLRLTDSANLYDILLPATAQKASLAGLWVGEAQVSGVESKIAGFTGTTTSQSYPLRYIIHVDDGGTARVLSQVFLGKLAAEPHNFGICTQESQLNSADKGSASRIVAAHMPLDRVLDGLADTVNPEPLGSGSLALGGTLARTIATPFNDAVSPFVHQYHPDHDNKSGATALVSGQESYDISRTVTFTFAATAPDGVSATGYGSSTIAGTYAETITGLRKDTLTLSGSVLLRRVSEIGAITP